MPAMQLSDWGMAVKLEEKADGGSEAPPRLVAVVPCVRGTKGYMAPEAYVVNIESKVGWRQNQEHGSMHADGMLGWLNDCTSSTHHHGVHCMFADLGYACVP